MRSIALLLLVAVMACTTASEPRPVSSPTIISSQVAGHAEEAPSAPELPDHRRWLPAGTYFRDWHYEWRGDSWPEPKWVVAAGPFSGGEQASRAAEAQRSLDLPPGYPWAVHADDLEPAEAGERGIFVVAGLFVERADAEAVSRALDGLGVFPLASQKEATARLHARHGASAPRSIVVQIDDGGAVPAFSERAIVRLLNLDGRDGRGERSAAVRAEMTDSTSWDWDDFAPALDAALAKLEPACHLAPGSVHLTEMDEVVGFEGFVRARCGEASVFVRDVRTRVGAVVHRVSGESYRIVQPYYVLCDQAFHGAWSYDLEGRRALPSPALDVVEPRGCAP